MASNNNYIQLLIELGVSDKSKQNINSYIEQLKDLSKVKISLEVDNLSSTNKSFNETNKIIEDLQDQVKQLKGELKGLGGTKLGIDGLEDFKKEIGQSIRSIGDLEQATKKFNGNMTLNYKTVTKIDPLTDEEYKDDVLKSINATLRDVDGRIKNVTFRPEFDNNGFLKGINQVSESVKNVDFKDFDKKLLKVEETMRQLGRQGQISAKEIDRFYDELDNIKVDKSVSALDDLNRRMTELSNKDNHTNKLANAMTNIKNQVAPMVNQLQALDKIDGLDKLGLEKVINELNKLSNTPIQTDAELKEVNAEFKNAERSAKEFIKEGQRISKVDNEIEKLQTTIAKLQSQGSLSSSQADKFLIDTNSVEKTTEAVKRLENQINQTVNSTTSTNKIKNAMEGISPTVDRLNEKLDIMVNKLGSNVDTSRLEKIRNEIQQIGNTKLTTIDDIAKLNVQLSETEKSITQLGVASNATSRFEDSIRKANKLLDDLEQSGYGVSSSIDDFRKKLNNIPTNDLAQVKNLVNDIEKDLDEAGRQRAVIKLLDEMEEKAHLLESRLDRTKNLFSRTYDPTEAQKTANVITRLREEMDKIRVDPLAATTREMDALRNVARIANTEVASFHANSTTAARNSMGVLDSLKVAMEKFPIWIETIVQNKSS